MKTDEIKHLLERYYNGETSIEEENILKDFFLTSEVPEDMMSDKRIFQGLCDMASDGLDTECSGLQSRLEKNIDMWDMEAKKERHKTYSLLRYLGGVAAAVIILVGIGLTFSYKTENAIPDTFDNPQEAYLETQKALQLFTDALNKGSAGLQKAKSATEKVENKLDNVIGF